MSEFPAVPQGKDDLFVAAMRHANDVSLLLNELSAELGQALERSPDDKGLERMHELLQTRFNRHSGVHLFIAASNLRIELPEDLQGNEVSETDDDYDPSRDM